MNEKILKILITGATGMVGKNLIEHESIKKFNILSPNSSELNLLNYEEVHDYIANNLPDLIVHAAGKVGGIQDNMSNPVDFLVQNMDMGRNIILSAQSNGVKKLINLGSSCIYPKYAKNPIKEELLLTGELESTNEGYALAKILVMKLCEYIANEDSKFIFRTILPCNLYGKYDKFDPKHSHMVPAVIKKIHEAKEKQVYEIDIWGDGTAKREFMYAADFADFLIFAIENIEKLPQNLNVGVGQDYSINEYYALIANLVGYKGKFTNDTSKPTGMQQKLIDISKLNDLGWRHSTSLESGLKKTYNYYLNEVIND